MLPISSLDLSLACFCEPFGESLASVNQLRKTGGRNTRRHITDRLMRVLAFRALGSVGQCPLLQEKERAKETERERKREIETERGPVTALTSVHNRAPSWVSRF